MFLVHVYMFQFFTGVVVGVWIGTKYDCRPAIEAAVTILAAHAPKKRDN